MFLLVGLGNPGRRYAGNRHNIGFMAADEIHRRHRFSPWRARFEGEISEGLLGGERAYLLKPATYMNESGRSVGQAARFYKLRPADIVVIYDELDLPPGKLRMKTGGGTAGHKGLKSIEAHIGKDFRRMRVGIGHPGARELVNSYVLHDFAKSDREWVEPLLTAVAEHVPLLAKEDDATFMNRIHLAVARPSDESATKDAPGVAPPAPGSRDKDPSRRGALAGALGRLLGRGG
jgi:PTH1 family peptidyl-tRNA hydrolase